MEGITNAFYGETFKYILLFGSIAIYAFVLVVIVLKHLHKEQNNMAGGNPGKGKKTPKIEGNDMMSLWEEDNVKKKDTSADQAQPNDDSEDNQYEEVFDNAINQVKSTEEESSHKDIDIEFDDDEDDDEELRNILNLDS